MLQIFLKPRPLLGDFMSAAVTFSVLEAFWALQVNGWNWVAVKEWLMEKSHVSPSKPTQELCSYSSSYNISQLCSLQTMKNGILYISKIDSSLNIDSIIWENGALNKDKYWHILLWKINSDLSLHATTIFFSELLFNHYLNFLFIY